MHNVITYYYLPMGILMVIQSPRGVVKNISFINDEGPEIENV
jgi:hypothetical protein